MALEPLPFRGLSPPPGFAMFFYADYAKRWSALRGEGLSPFSRGGESRDVKRPWLAPKGHRLCEPYKKPLTEGGLCLESITSFPYRGRLG